MHTLLVKLYFLVFQLKINTFSIHCVIECKLRHYLQFLLVIFDMKTKILYLVNIISAEMRLESTSVCVVLAADNTHTHSRTFVSGFVRRLVRRMSVLCHIRRIMSYIWINLYIHMCVWVRVCINAFAVSSE